MLTLDEAIKHAEEKVEENKIKAEEFNNEGLTTSSENYRLCCFEDYVKCTLCAEEHEQLAEWLKQLQEVKKIVDEWNAMPEDMKYHAEYHSLVNGAFHKILDILKGGKR